MTFRAVWLIRDAEVGLKRKEPSSEANSMQVLPPANVLPLFEERFAFLSERYDFVLAQTTEIPSCAWYRAQDRAVVIRYDFTGDAAVDLELEIPATGERHPLADVVAFAQPVAARLQGVRERKLVEAEIERTAGLLLDHCEDFLAGRLDAFRRSHREALLVKDVRAAAQREFYEGDARRALALYEALRPYWNEHDAEYHARLRSGDSSLAYLRRRV